MGKLVWLSMPSMYIVASLSWDFRPRNVDTWRGPPAVQPTKPRVSLILSCVCVKCWCSRMFEVFLLLVEVHHVKFNVFQGVFAGCFKFEKKLDGPFGVLTPAIPLRYQNPYYGGAYPYSQNRSRYRLSRGAEIQMPPRCVWYCDIKISKWVF